MCWAHIDSEFRFRVDPMVFDPIAWEVEGVKTIHIDNGQAEPPVLGNFGCSEFFDMLGLRIVQLAKPGWAA
jgi:hypothetical protein